MPDSAKKAFALRTQLAIVSASLRQGINIVSSTAFSPQQAIDRNPRARQRRCRTRALAAMALRIRARAAEGAVSDPRYAWPGRQDTAQMPAGRRLERKSA
jgi:hypothetical protein